jgi:hypothetical protein
MTTGAPSEINYSNGSNRGTASTCRRYPLLIRWNCKNNLYKWWNLSLPCGFRTQKWKFVFSDLQFLWSKKLNSREIGGSLNFQRNPASRSDTPAESARKHVALVILENRIRRRVRVVSETWNHKILKFMNSSLPHWHVAVLQLFT